MAANIINERYGWVQSEEIGIRHRQEVSDCCMEILRKMGAFGLFRQVYGIKRLDELVCQTCPVIHRPTLALFCGWGNFNSYHIVGKRVVAAVKSIQADKRAIYFSDTRFVEQWMKGKFQFLSHCR